MGGFHQDVGFKVSAEQRSLLARQNYTLRPLSSVGALSPLKVLDVSWQPIALFLILVLVQSMVNSAALCAVVLVLLLAFPLMEFLVLVIGTVATAIGRGVRWKAVLFWTYWPFWKLVLCVAAAIGGKMLGDFLWNGSYLPAAQIGRMQVYHDINPINASGIRLQDAGVVTFDGLTGVNRMMTGCLVDGPTYCIAAIVPVVEKDGLRTPANMSQYDLFMAGTDCCDCPGEFRCGDWNNPGKSLGGLRETDAGKSKYYRLAAADFAANFQKSVVYPIFLEWYNEPEQTLSGWVSNAHSNRALALVSIPILIIVAVVILNGRAMGRCAAAADVASDRGSTQTSHERRLCWPNWPKAASKHVQLPS
ncbi:unnamed protein product [Effrenium voratum]|nr:unnamed protein product [Effrenium voratum]